MLVSEVDTKDKENSAIQLMKFYDFSKISHMFEIGGAPFIQSQTILNKFPNLHATLTDLENERIDAFKKYGNLKKYTLKTLDVCKETLIQKNSLVIYNVGCRLQL